MNEFDRFPNFEAMWSQEDFPIERLPADSFGLLFNPESGIQRYALGSNPIGVVRFVVHLVVVGPPGEA